MVPSTPKQPSTASPALLQHPQLVPPQPSPHNHYSTPCISAPLHTATDDSKKAVKDLMSRLAPSTPAGSYQPCANSTSQSPYLHQAHQLSRLNVLFELFIIYLDEQPASLPRPNQPTQQPSCVCVDNTKASSAAPPGYNRLSPPKGAAK
jgi:hypothetical protein